jgi:DNA-binding LytR/AlgR family response regulator
MTDRHDLPSLGEPGEARLGLALIILAFGVLLGVLGPFGSYLGISLPLRVLHYTANMAVIGAMAVAANALAARYLYRGPVPLWGSMVIALVIAPPGALVVMAHLRFFAPQVLPHVTFAELCFQTAVINVLVSLVVRAVRTLARTRQVAQPQAAAPLPVVAEDRRSDDILREKLPLPLRRAPILALSSEDHYLRVHTDRGQALILMSLSQAIDALGEDAGLRIHRSHWVARDAVVDSARKDGGLAVRLANGLTLPASRSGRRLLEDARLV